MAAQALEKIGYRIKHAVVCAAHRRLLVSIIVNHLPVAADFHAQPVPFAKFIGNEVGVFRSVYQPHSDLYLMV